MIKDVTNDPYEWHKFWYDVIDEHTVGISNTQNNSHIQRGSSSIMYVGRPPATPTRQDTHRGEQ